MFSKEKKIWQAVIFREYRLWVYLQRALDTIAFIHVSTWHIFVPLQPPSLHLCHFFMPQVSMKLRWHWGIMRFIFSHSPPCVPPRLKFDWKLQSVKTKEVLFFKYACSVQIILSGRIFDLGCLREIIIIQQFLWLAFSVALPMLTSRRAVRLPLWIVLCLKKNQGIFPWIPEFQIMPSSILSASAGVLWSILVLSDGIRKRSG